LTNLAELLSSGMRRGEHPLRIRVDAEPLWMSTKAATSLSLAVNELLTNAAKHNKRNGKKGETSHDAIEINLQRQNEKVLVAVQDYGPGFPPEFDPVADAHIGLQLVLTLVEHDLRGAASFSNHFDQEEGKLPAGGRVEILFSEQSLPE
jgi:two-component sensor histidine kinase